jgi:hypothetical protein
MSIQKLYTVGGNLATLYNNTTALYMNWIDPYNPMDLPDKTFRLKYKPSTVPTPYEGQIHPIGVTASLYDADENIWDVTTYDTLDYLMANDTNLIAILGGNLSGVSILNGSFSGCTALTSTIALPYFQNARHTFTNCSSLSSITTSGFNELTSIREAFDNCTALSAIPDNCFNALIDGPVTSDLGSNTGTFNAVTSVGNNCFNSLNSFYYSYDQYLNTGYGCFANLQYIGNDSFNGTIEPVYGYPALPLNITSFGSGCFNGVLGWGGAWFPKGVTAIPEHCFESFDGGSSAFAESNLITFPITSFPNLTSCQYMFKNCTALTIDAIDFIERHSDIDSRWHFGCFEGCTALTNYAQATALYPTWFGIWS